MNSNRKYTGILRGLSWLVGFACLAGAVPASAITICAANVAQIKAALSLGTLQSSAYTIQIVQGIYLMDVDVNTSFSVPTTIEGGYSANCASRTINAGNTTINAQGHNFYLFQEVASPQAQLSLDGLTVSNSNGVVLEAGAFGSFSNDAGSLHVSNVRFAQIAGGIAFSIYNNEATFENMQIDHLFATGASAVNLYIEGGAQVLINHLVLPP